MSKPQTIKIDDTEYVRADSVNAPAETLDGKPFVIIRSYGAGVFAGYLVSRIVEGGIVAVVMDRCIRLHRWTGCSLSQVCHDGVAGTGENRFSMPVDGHEIIHVIEILPCDEKAQLAIQAVKAWKL